MEDNAPMAVVEHANRLGGTRAAGSSECHREVDIAAMIISESPWEACLAGHYQCSARCPGIIFVVRRDLLFRVRRWSLE